MSIQKGNIEPNIHDDPFFSDVLNWFQRKNWKPFPFQMDCWKHYSNGYHGLLNAPTGSGKTYALLVPILREINLSDNTGLKAIWLSPIRALTKEIAKAAERLVAELNLPIRIGVRTGDTKMSERSKQKTNPPDLLITTPESLHIMLSNRNYSTYLSSLQTIVADEWHELMGSKRGVLVELALSRIKSISNALRVWGISATIGNMTEAVHVLMGVEVPVKFKMIKSKIKKRYEVISILPDDIENFPWAGHVGTRLLHKVIPIIEKSESTLIFTNTRSQCEIWYHRLLEVEPELAGLLAMHHSAISDELRAWVEDSLSVGKLKAVVCTSSLDLGVDFGPVESIIQIGGPKGVARFTQRAGRSGHRPGATSRIYFVPAHALELIEGAALRKAINEQIVESRIPFIRCFDVLVQYLFTLAASDGFDPDQIYREIKSTFCFNSIDSDDWDWIMNYVLLGSQSLQAYDEYNKAAMDKSGIVRMKTKRIAYLHRMSIGTIVGSHSLNIKYGNGRKLGTVEEYFISHLSPGDVFWFAGRTLEFVRIKNQDVLVERTKSSKAKVPSWQGGRMPLSSEMAEVLRDVIEGAFGEYHNTPEMQCLAPLMSLQKQMSVLPKKTELLIEYFKTSEGYHLTIFPFEGRIVHEGLGGLFAYRISKIKAITFSIAMNDYGLELLSDTPIPLEQAIDNGLFSTHNLTEDITHSINKVEMAKRRFRDIATIAGLIFQGYPGRYKRERHLQSSAGMLFDIFHEYEPDNKLYIQAYEEASFIQYEEQRLRAVLDRIDQKDIIIMKPEKPTPFAFPIMVDRLREGMSTERLEDRVKRMQLSMKA